MKRLYKKTILLSMCLNIASFGYANDDLKNEKKQKLEQREELITKYLNKQYDVKVAYDAGNYTQAYEYQKALIQIGNNDHDYKKLHDIYIFNLNKEQKQTLENDFSQHMLAANLKFPKHRTFSTLACFFELQAGHKEQSLNTCTDALSAEPNNLYDNVNFAHASYFNNDISNFKIYLDKSISMAKTNLDLLVIQNYFVSMNKIYSKKEADNYMQYVDGFMK